MKDLSVFFTGPLNILLGKKILEVKNKYLKGTEFLQLFVETSLNKLSKKRQKITLLLKNYLIEVLVYLSFKS